MIHKRILLIFAAASVLVSCATKEKESNPAPSEEPQPVTDTVHAPDYSKLTASNHPRLLMSDYDMARMRARITLGEDAVLKQMHQMVMSIADSPDILNGDPIKYELDASEKRILMKAYDATNRIWSLSYAYRMTKDKKYLTAAEKVINTVCDFPDWNAKVHFLDPAQMCDAVSIGYDWLYKDLSDATKRKVEHCIQEYAFKVAINKEYSWNFYEAVDNWCTSCCTGLNMGALAIYEAAPEVCRQIIETSEEPLKRVVKLIYYPTGVYPEGYGYWITTTICMTLGFTVLEECLGTDFGLSQIEGVSKTSKFLLFMDGGPSGLAFNFSDNDASRKPAYSQWYFAYKYNNVDALYNELRMIKSGDYTKNAVQACFLPYSLAMASKMPNLNLSEVKAPTDRLYQCESTQTALCLIRTGWTGTVSDSYLGIKGGLCNMSHQHMDIGSFVYDCQGLRWVCDLGHQVYSTVEKYVAEAGGYFWDLTQKSMRWDVLRLNNKFHSTIVVNGNKQNVNGFARFPKTWDTPEDIGATIDLTEVLNSDLKSCKRSFHIKGDVLVIEDEIEALPSKDANIEIRMVTSRTVDVATDGITLSEGTKRLSIKTASDGPAVQYKSWSCEPLVYYDAANPGKTVVGSVATVPAGSKALFTTTLSILK